MIRAKVKARAKAKTAESRAREATAQTPIERPDQKAMAAALSAGSFGPSLWRLVVLTIRLNMKGQIDFLEQVIAQGQKNYVPGFDALLERQQSIFDEVMPDDLATSLAWNVIELVVADTCRCLALVKSPAEALRKLKANARRVDRILNGVNRT